MNAPFLFEESKEAERKLLSLLQCGRTHFIKALYIGNRARSNRVDGSYHLVLKNDATHDAFDHIIDHSRRKFDPNVALIDEYLNRFINNAAMSDEQKIEMLAVVEYSNALHEYLITGGISEIKEILPEVNDANGRRARVSQQTRQKYEILECEDSSCGGGGCSVNWRSVWGGAVIGLTVGAAGGAKVGCAGGTVALPLFGTVTGCVGGAVFGGAGGFAGGALTSIASELLTSCGR